MFTKAALEAVGVYEARADGAMFARLATLKRFPDAAPSTYAVAARAAWLKTLSGPVLKISFL